MRRRKHFYVHRARGRSAFLTKGARWTTIETVKGEKLGFLLQPNSHTGRGRRPLTSEQEMDGPLRKLRKSRLWGHFSQLVPFCPLDSPLRSSARPGGAAFFKFLLCQGSAGTLQACRPSLSAAELLLLTPQDFETSADEMARLEFKLSKRRRMPLILIFLRRDYALPLKA